MKVLKFGSASIATAQKIRHIATIVIQQKKNIIVFSSMAGTSEWLTQIAQYFYERNKEKAIEATDQLQKSYANLAIELLSNPNICKEAQLVINETFDYIRDFANKDLFSLFEEREVLAQGELISTVFFHLYLKQLGINAVILPALDYIRKDRNLRIDSPFLETELKKMIASLPHADLYLTQGYICRNAYGEIDDLGKGGTDYTAALVGAAIQALEIQIWADVEVMQNCDTNYVDNTYTVEQLNFDEAAELAYFGAKILHPTRIAPAKLANIPIRLKCTQNTESKGTIISNETKKHEIKAVAVRDNITAIKIKSGEMLLAHGFLRKVFEIFERYHTSVDMITSSEIGIALTIDDNKNLAYIVDDLAKYGTVITSTNMAMIAIVGDFDIEKSEFASKILDAIKEIPVAMISYGGSKYNFSLLINENYMKQTLQILNDKLFRII